MIIYSTNEHNTYPRTDAYGNDPIALVSDDVFHLRDKKTTKFYKVNDLGDLEETDLEDILYPIYSRYNWSGN